MAPLITVIPTTGRPALLERTLESLARCERPASFAGTFVVENGSPAGAERIALRCGAQYLHVASANKSHALNRVLECVGDVLIYFSDDDVRFDSKALSAIASASDNRECGEFFGGSVRVDFEEEPPDWVKPLLPRSAVGWDISDDAAWRRWPFFLGCNWAAFASDLRRAGRFDPQLGPGSPTFGTGQERSMQTRLRESGVRSVRVPEAVVWHWVPRDRCSPKWILRRKYRSGISEGIRLRMARRFGVATPVVPWMKLIRAVQFNASRWIRGGRAGRLAAHAQISYHLGVLAGFRGGADSSRGHRQVRRIRDAL